MNADRLKLVKGTFYFLIVMDLFGDALAGFLPFAGIFNFFGSAVTNTGEAALFMVVMDDYYGNQIQVLVKWLMVAVVGIVAIIFLLGGLVI